MGRIDKKNIKVAGKYMLEQPFVTSTGMTENEDFWSDLVYYSYDNKPHHIEVKTISKTARVVNNPKYIKDVKDKNNDDAEIWEGDKWMLNIDCLNGRFENSKWWKIITGVYDGLIYVDERDNTIKYYDKDTIQDAFLGTMYLKCPHTKMLKDNRWNWEKKAIIDLTQAVKIPIKDEWVA